MGEGTLKKRERRKEGRGRRDVLVRKGEKRERGKENFFVFVIK